jgi:hypothetical protein
MARASIPSPRPSVPTTTGVVIRFDGSALTTSEARVVRTFADPRPAEAVATPVDHIDTEAPAVWPEPADTLQVLTSPERKPKSMPWLARPDHAEAPLASEVEVDSGRLRWRPGRAVLEGNVARSDDVMAGLVEFAFYEGELRKLEAALPPFEATASGDVPFAYGIDDAGRPHWQRFRETMEQLATLRLTFARLEPRLGRASRSMPIEARRTFARLCTRANIEERLEAFSNRLEACEDLYEGAVDRITDHGWWQRGQRAEVTIVALLAVETGMLVIDLALRMFRH